jgi:3',5'-cyclic-AMP phosphodiesterase
VLLGQLTDTHLLDDPDATLWGHHPTGNLAAVLDALPALDSLVVTGDIAEDGSLAAYRRADALTASRAQRRFFIPGNHDDVSTMQDVFGPVDAVQVHDLSDEWSLVLLDSKWRGHDAGYLGSGALARLTNVLANIERHVVVCLHHPPVSPCPARDCGLVDAEPLLRVLRRSPVKAVLSGHVHQSFAVEIDGITYFGAPSTLGQLRHGGDPHYVDTDEPAAGQTIELHADGSTTRRVIEMR